MDNFIKKISSIKFINFVCFIVCFSYIFFAISFVFIDYSIAVEKENQFNTLVAYANSVNQIAQKNKPSENVYNDDNSLPLYNSGVEAITSAYNNVYNANSFMFTSTGVLSLEVLGISVVANLSYTAIRFEKEISFLENINTLKYTSAPSVLATTIKSMTDNAKKAYKKNGDVFYVETVNINGDIPNYSGCSISNNRDMLVFSDSLFIINENTIKNELYYKIKYKGSKIQNYYVQVELDCEKGLVDFSKYFHQTACCVEPPNFKKFVVMACIDSGGQIVALNFNTDVVLKRDTPLGIKDCPCSMQLNIAVSNVNKTIDYVVEGF